MVVGAQHGCLLERHPSCEVRVACKGRGTTAPVSMPWTTVQALARDLPETAPHVTSRRPTARSSAPPFTWAVVWSREVLTGGVNPPSIDGKDGVAASVSGAEAC